MSAPFSTIPAARLNGLLLFLCEIALASPRVAAVPGKSAYLFWAARAIGMGFAIAALVWPGVQKWSLGGVMLFLVLVPCALQMHYRSWTGPETWCHDSVVQFEEAIRMVKQKKNPYKEDFNYTSLARWKDWEKNPALHHFVYPPLLLYFSVPVEMASRAILWKTPDKVEQLGARFYDQRIVVLAFFLGLMAVTWHYLKEHPHRIGLTALIVLNPWVGPFVVEGRNDAAMLFWAVGAWIAYEGGESRYGHLLLGLGIATKTLLLPMVPFIAFAHRKQWALCLGLLLAPLVFTSIPYLVADPKSFVEDLFGAPAGLGTHPFEIRGVGGFGFANLVLLLGWAKSPDAYFPFSIFQAAALVPVLIYGFRSLKKDSGNGNMFLWSTASIFVVLFFGRFIHDNYIGSLLSLAVMSQTARGISPPASSTSSGG